MLFSHKAREIYSRRNRAGIPQRYGDATRARFSIKFKVVGGQALGGSWSHQEAWLLFEA